MSFVGRDQFDIDGQEVAELAQLSLDEPELEGSHFNRLRRVKSS